MKNLTLLSIFLTFFTAISCVPKPEMNGAKACVQGLLEAIKTENYNDAGKYYASVYQEKESGEQRTEKLKKLNETLGKIESYQLVDSLLKDKEGESAMVLTYKIKHSKLTTVEKFVVVKDEGD